LFSFLRFKAEIAKVETYTDWQEDKLGSWLGFAHSETENKEIVEKHRNSSFFSL